MNKPTHNEKGEKLTWVYDRGFTKDQLEAIKKLAEQQNTFGPDVEEHPESFNDECYCKLCISYI